MKVLCCFLVTCIYGCFPPCTSAQDAESGDSETAGWVRSESIDKTTQEKLDRFLAVTEELKQITSTPGAVIALIVDGELIYRGGFGYANLEDKIPVKPETLFAIGSCTKAMTGAAAAQLVHEGKLDWKDRVTDYIPSFKLSDEYATQHVRLQELLTHTSGLARHDSLWLDSNLTRDEILGKLPHLEMGSALRERYEYNNLMFTVGGIVTANANGTSWDQLIRDRIFKPLKMNQSWTTYEEFMRSPSRSMGYNPGGKDRLPHRNIDVVGPAGSVTSSIVDMTKWLRMLVNGGRVDGKSLVDGDSFEYTVAPHVALSASQKYFYGIGWEVVWERGTKGFKHGGGIDGQNCFVKVVPSAGFGLVIMANQQSDFDDLLSIYASDLFVHSKLERRPEKEASMKARRDRYLSPSTTSDLSAAGTALAGQATVDIKEKFQCRHKMDEYVGVYRHLAYGDIKIRQTGSGQYDFVFGETQGPIKHIGYEYFGVQVDPTSPQSILEIGFQDDPSGAVASLATKFDFGSPNLLFKKLVANQAAEPTSTSNSRKYEVAKEASDQKKVEGKQVVLKSNSLNISHQVGSGWPEPWTILPEVALDELEVVCQEGRKVRVVFRSDIDEKKFIVGPNESVQFDIILPDGQIAKTSITGKPSTS